jgi:hypothetical protein
MANHIVTLNWGPAGLQPDTDPVVVQTGDTISFQLGIAPANSKFRITMDYPELFSPAEATDSDTAIAVVQAAVTTYTCELSGGVDVPDFVSATNQGGHVRPG